MAKAAFHKNQKVFVKPVGTWAVVEQVLPQWVKGLETLKSVSPLPATLTPGQKVD